MPELPEVETVRRTLEHFVTGKVIRDIDVYYEKIIRNVSIDEFKRTLIGKSINEISRYGKYLIFHLDDVRLISHLRMEGKYFIKELDAKKEKHEHIIFYFSDGSTMRYNDVRKFGTMDIVLKDELYTNSPLKKLGLEPFEEEMTASHLKSLIKHKSVAIKTALLDQSIIVGLGNIYVDEVLFLSKLHPTTPCNKLKNRDFDNLIENSVIVLNKAIKLGGTTIRSYTSSLGITGRFQNELNVHMRKDEDCEVCQTTIVKTKVNGRGTYFCPTCQK